MVTVRSVLNLGCRWLLMADIVSTEVRSRMMSGIRSKDTMPEITVRKGLHRLGFRYRVNDRRIPGKPDLHFPKWNALVFVHGCFWHGHDCHLFRLPKTRTGYWNAKIEKNRERDRLTESNLMAGGWRLAIVWECALKGRQRLEQQQMLDGLAIWLRSDNVRIDIRGKSFD